MTIDIFGEPVSPCGDCIDNRYCNMNCSTPFKPGTAWWERLAKRSRRFIKKRSGDNYLAPLAPQAQQHDKDPVL